MFTLTLKAPGIELVSTFNDPKEFAEELLPEAFAVIRKAWDMFGEEAPKGSAPLKIGD